MPRAGTSTSPPTMMTSRPCPVMPPRPTPSTDPEVAATLNPAKAPAAPPEDEEDVDLFGSDDEEEDAEAARIREERLAEYHQEKEGKTKPAAKSRCNPRYQALGCVFPSFLFVNPAGVNTELSR